LLTVNEEGS